MQRENRKYKDSVFCDLFYSDRDAKKNLLELYNALFDEKLEDPDAIEKVRLEDAIFMNMKNDVSFIANRKRIILSEHQSTVNPNMPVRALMYIGREYEKIVPTDTRYSSKLFRIPEPSFFVFYNGLEDCPLESELSLSSAYIDQENLSGHLELKVKVININTCKHHPILTQSRTLGQYSVFIEKVRRNKGSREAIRMAVEKCIQEGILADYLTRKGSEVVNMLIAEYNYERDIEVHSQEAAEEERKLLLQLIQMLSRDGRISDIEKASTDAAYLDQLLAEYGLS